MADFDLHFRVQESGAIFSPSASARIMRDITEDVEKTVGREGENDVHNALHQVLRNPTGYYESRVSVEREGGDSVIHGDNVIYGPWLEGVGERNRTTRFRGYMVFRRVAQMLEMKAGRIADNVVDRGARRLG